MEGCGFKFVCAGCLVTRGALDSETLPETCPECGAHGAWTGPFASPRFAGEHLVESPLYLAASRPETTER